MGLKAISAEQLALETGKVLKQAAKRPVVVRGPGRSTLVLRLLADDELADELVVQHPSFRASIRRARRNRKAGRGIPLADVRRRK